MEVIFRLFLKQVEQPMAYQQSPRPGASEGRPAPCPASPNCVCTTATDDRHRMPPIAWTRSAHEAIEKLAEILEQTPRVRIVSRSETYLHAEFKTRFLRFVDDVEFHVDTEAHQIHFRSASRVGYSDFGVNRRRMERICEQFARETSRQL